MIHFILYILFITLAFSISLEDKPIELMIDPKSPDVDLVKMFQSK